MAKQTLKERIDDREKQTLEERIDDREKGIVKALALMAVIERSDKLAREQEARHEQSMRDADARHAEIMASVARLNGGNHSREA